MTVKSKRWTINADQSGQNKSYGNFARFTDDKICEGAGYSEAPIKYPCSKLTPGCLPPKSYKDGLTGGRGKSERDHSWHFCRVDSQGGFGGGGGCNERMVDGEWITYQGAGGGFKGGSIAFWVDSQCEGGGGGSFSADPNAKFDHHYVEFGYCKIERQISEN